MILDLNQHCCYGMDLQLMFFGKEFEGKGSEVFTQGARHL